MAGRVVAAPGAYDFKVRGMLIVAVWTNDTLARSVMYLEVLQLILVGSSIDRDVHGQYISQATLVAQPAGLHALNTVLQLKSEHVSSGRLVGLAQALH